MWLCASAQYNFVLQPRNRLREKFPLPGMSHDGRNTLTAEGYALLSGLLQLDPSRRITADKALKHPWYAFPLSLICWLWALSAQSLCRVCMPLHLLLPSPPRSPHGGDAHPVSLLTA